MPIKVKIENFQSIKEIEFEIDKYTVLTGPSNSGKSAICRAIEGALFNRSGDGFVRNGEKHAKVTISTDTHEIVWTKGSGKNHYTVNGEVYDKVGTDVPTVVSDMGFKDIELTRSKIRPQMGTDQFDILFLIREQGSLISEVFSVLGRLDVITKAGKECNSDLKSKKSLLKTRYEDLSSVDRKLVNYTGFEKVSLATDSLDQDNKLILELKSTLAYLKESDEKLEKYSKDIKILEPSSDVKIPEEVNTSEVNKLNALKSANDKIVSLSDQISKLEEVDQVSVEDFKGDKILVLVSRLSSIYNLYEEKSKEIISLSDVNSIETPIDINDSEINVIENLKSARDQIVKLDLIIEEIQSFIESSNSRSLEIESELHDLLGGLEECPLCEQTMKGKAFV